MKQLPLTKLSLFLNWLGILFLILISQLSYAVEREQYLYFYDVDGLPRNIVTCIEQDKYGYTWVGTGNGIARYDGHTFRSYKELKGFQINDLHIDQDNNLWVSSDQALLFYNRISDQFEVKREA